MTIAALKYGESVFGENYILKGGRKDVLLPISFTIYLIQTENKNMNHSQVSRHKKAQFL